MPEITKMAENGDLAILFGTEEEEKMQKMSDFLAFSGILAPR